MNEKKNIVKVPDVFTKRFGAMGGLVWASFLEMAYRKRHEQEMKEKKMISKEKEEEEN